MQNNNGKGILECNLWSGFSLSGFVVTKYNKAYIGFVASKMNYAMSYDTWCTLRSHIKEHSNFVIIE